MYTPPKKSKSQMKAKQAKREDKKQQKAAAAAVESVRCRICGKLFIGHTKQAEHGKTHTK